MLSFSLRALCSCSLSPLLFVPAPPLVQEHNFAGVLAWLMGGLSHVARLCLMFDVSAAHGQSIGGGAIFLMLSSAMIILVYFFYAYRSSLSATVAAISAAAMSVFLSAALFHASSLNHVAPGSAIGAAVGLWLYALLVYPMMCMRQMQSYVWMLEGCNTLVWTSVFGDSSSTGSTAGTAGSSSFTHPCIALCLCCACTDGCSCATPPSTTVSAEQDCWPRLLQPRARHRIFSSHKHPYSSCLFLAVIFDSSLATV